VLDLAMIPISGVLGTSIMSVHQRVEVDITYAILMVKAIVGSFVLGKVLEMTVDMSRFGVLPSGLDFGAFHLPDGAE